MGVHEFQQGASNPAVASTVTARRLCSPNAGSGCRLTAAAASVDEAGHTRVIMNRGHWGGDS